MEPEWLRRELDDNQLEAVTADDGPILVFAGAGSGKTRVLTYRIAYLLTCRNVPAHRIMAVTFTNKAAKEMRQRLEQLVGNLFQPAWVGTFHAVCTRMLRLHGHSIGLPKDFVIYDEEDQLSLVKRILKEKDIDPNQFPPPAILSAIGAAKEQQVTPEELAEIVENPFQETVAKVYRDYQTRLQEAKAVDFDDLLWLALRMLEEKPEVADYYQSRFLHILVDEYQDVNRTQHQLTMLLAAQHRNLFLVGDDDQSIYSWRGSDVRLMLEVRNHFPDLRVFVLTNNYRSTQVILDAAWYVIKRNIHRQEKRLRAVRPAGEPLILFRAQDDREEAAFVAATIIDLVKQGANRYSDFAVIYRINAQSRPFEEVFVRWGIPYRVVGALRFYERKEVRDIIAYLRLLFNPADQVSLLRIINTPPRGIGEQTMSRIQELASLKGLPLGVAIFADDLLPSLPPRQRGGLMRFRQLMERLRQGLNEWKLSELIQAIVELTDYDEYVRKAEGDLVGQERMSNILQLATAAEQAFGDEPAAQSLPRFLEQIALLSPQDAADWRGDLVSLITAHSAKGLEFPIVFVTGLEEGLFPHSRSLDDPFQLEEERRLFYVALTRAKDRVYVTYAQRRGFSTGRWGESRFALTDLSRFLLELPSALVVEWRGVPTAQGLIPMPSPPTAAPRTPVSDWSKVLQPVSPSLPQPIRASEPGQSPAQGPFPVKTGARVRHRDFGIGKVIAVAADRRLLTILVQFDDPSVGLKRLALDMAPIEILSD
ncbi:MAG: UvrD-helicase domain-containing protein [Armatimonadetes bacterium]|nr:UvrD-helicase domain-containing protein [Armatimonadota bacterium]MDW8120748.1 UvrD-helicase domain-containing protein [Armatimonadota bacterium]